MYCKAEISIFDDCIWARIAWLLSGTRPEVTNALISNPSPPREFSDFGGTVPLNYTQNVHKSPQNNLVGI
jgi:hypothetical protein